MSKTKQLVQISIPRCEPCVTAKPKLKGLYKEQYTYVDAYELKDNEDHPYRYLLDKYKIKGVPRFFVIDGTEVHDLGTGFGMQKLKKIEAKLNEVSIN